MEQQREVCVFGFSGEEFSDEFSLLAKKIIKNALDDVRKLLKLEFEDSATVDPQVRNLYKYYMVKVEEPLARFKAATTEIFNIPKEVVVPCWIGAGDVTQEELKDLQKEVEELEKQYLEEEYFKEVLLKEKDNFEKIKPLYEHVSEVLNNECNSKYQKILKDLELLKTNEPVEM